MRMIEHAAGPAPDDAAQSYRPVFLAALISILSLGGAGLGWGMYARLDAAVVTRGVLIAESERKSIEHLEGGSLERLWVRAGDRVKKGQIVATLDATQTRETLAQVEVERRALLFDIWRLDHEQAGAPRLDAATAPGATAAERAAHVAAQTRLFDARQRSHKGQILSLMRQIDNLTAQIAASTAQEQAAVRQLLLWREERTQTAILVASGAAPRQRLLEFDRTIAALEGDREENGNLVQAARQDIARSTIDIETLKQQRLAEIAANLSEAHRAADGLTSRMRAAQDVLERHILRAPQDGVIVNIVTVTPGAVVGTGMPLMDLVPDGDRLIVLARLPPEAIDTVRPGRTAKVRMTAYRRALVPVVAGEVTYVSADLLEDERDGSSYFEAHVTLDPAGVAALDNVALSVGMPVEVTIEIGARRAGDYILEPILRHTRNALNEE